jgi:hypothetical protein
MALDEVKLLKEKADGTFTEDLSGAKLPGAVAVPFDNTGTSLAALTVQAALVESEARIVAAESDIATLQTSVADILSGSATAGNATLLNGNNSAYYLNRANHTGSQAANTVSYDNTISGLVATDVKAALDELAAMGGGGHAIEDEGSPLTQRPIMNFVGAGVTVTDAGGKTVVTIPGGGGATAFIDLTDVPSTYAGHALKVARVNAAENAIEFYTPSSGGAQERVAIFDPDEVSPSGNVYDDLSAALAALQAVASPRRLIIRKPGVGISIPVPVATYNFAGVEVEAEIATSTFYPIIEFADGSTISNLPTRIINATFAGFNTTAPLHTVTAISAVSLESANFRNYGTEPFVQVNNAAQFVAVIAGLNSDGFSSGSPATTVVNVVSGATALVYVRESTNFCNSSDVFSDDGSGGAIAIYREELHVGGYNATHAGISSASFVVNNTSDDRIVQIIDQLPLAHGDAATAFDNFAAAFGYQAQANGSGSLAFGYNAIADSTLNIAIGYAAYAKNYADISIGFNATTGTSPGSGSNSVAIGRDVQGLSSEGVAIGHNAHTAYNVQGGVAIGFTAFARTNRGVAVGYQSDAFGLETVAIGYGAIARGASAIAIGKSATTHANTGPSVVIGEQAFADNGALSSVVVGDDARAETNAQHSVAIGYNIRSRISNTTRMPPLINDTQTGDSFQRAGGAEVVLTCEPLNMVNGTFVELILPAGVRFYTTEVGLVTSDANAVSTAGTVKFGTTVADASLSASLAPSDTQFNRTRDTTPLNINGVDTLRATVLTPATATTLIVRPYFKGLLIKN